MNDEDTLVDIGDIIAVYLTNGFFYEGRVLYHDKTMIKIHDFKSNKEQIFAFTSIDRIEVRGDKND